MVWRNGQEVPFQVNEDQDMMPSEVVRHFNDMLQHDLDSGRLGDGGRVKVEYLSGYNNGTKPTRIHPEFGMGCYIVFQKKIGESEKKWHNKTDKVTVLSRKQLWIARFEYDMGNWNNGNRGSNYPVYMVYSGRVFKIRNEVELKMAINRVLNDGALKRALEIPLDRALHEANATVAAEE